MHRLGRIPPAEAEGKYCARLQAGKHTGHTQKGVHKTGDASPAIRRSGAYRGGTCTR